MNRLLILMCVFLMMVSCAPYRIIGSISQELTTSEIQKSKIAVNVLNQIHVNEFKKAYFKEFKSDSVFIQYFKKGLINSLKSHFETNTIFSVESDSVSFQKDSSFDYLLSIKNISFNNEIKEHYYHNKNNNYINKFETENCDIAIEYVVIRMNDKRKIAHFYINTTAFVLTDYYAIESAIQKQFIDLNKFLDTKKLYED